MKLYMGKGKKEEAKKKRRRKTVVKEKGVLKYTLTQGAMEKGKNGNSLIQQVGGLQRFDMKYPEY